MPSCSCLEGTVAAATRNSLLSPTSFPFCWIFPVSEHTCCNPPSVPKNQQRRNTTKKLLIPNPFQLPFHFFTRLLVRNISSSSPPFLSRTPRTPSKPSYQGCNELQVPVVHSYPSSQHHRTWGSLLPTGTCSSSGPRADLLPAHWKPLPPALRCSPGLK